MFKKVDSRLNIPEMESSILSYWEKNKIFEKSVSEKPAEKTFSFFDGPPFATGTPHYGNLLAGTIKDVIPRFKAMQGYRVERVWGWDTHGLPIENIVEQELNFKSRLQVEEYGIDKFNEKCRSKVLKYADEWQKIVKRTGRWVDMGNAYLTMDFNYMESVWWVFKTLWEQDLIYKGHKVMPYCPRCSTGLSSFEVGQPGAYQDKSDKAITVKFQSVKDKNTYFLAWTTTPWTLPGNLALTLGKDIKYVKVEKAGKFYILAKDRLDKYKSEIGDKVVDEFKGSEIVGQKYNPVFNYYKEVKKAFVVVAGDFVSTEDGTGIVHTAPAFGEDDYLVCKENGIDFFMPVNDLGEFTIEVPEYAGQSVVSFETNQKIITELGDRVLKVEDITHSYPHCWRCDTPLIYKALDSWFVAETKLKDELIENNEKIKWVPKSVGAGRFANLLETAPDWNISRKRFWGTPLPVWECECGETQVFGGGEELSKAAGVKVNDFHLHNIQNIEVPCKCGKKAKVSGEVLDCWFESGAMPYGQIHYPFENKEKFEHDFPADFIAEGIDQTRGWFHSLLVLSTALKEEPSYKNVVVNGIVLAEDGQKMSKHLGNYTDPMVLFNRYGADAARFYMMASPAVKAGDLAFSEKGVDEVVKSLILRLWNSYSFFVTYAALDGFKPTGKLESNNVLDKWLVSVTNRLILEVTNSLEKYDIAKATKLLGAYVDELSNWYIRRSRKRFWKSEDDRDKNDAYETLYFALDSYVKLLAPFMPFVTDEIYKNLNGKKESVHLDEWPVAEKKAIDKELEASMELQRSIINQILSLRAEAGIKVRQPLSQAVVLNKKNINMDLKLFTQIVISEANIDSVSELPESMWLAEVAKDSKNYFIGEDEIAKIALNIDVSKGDLRARGIRNDFVRFIQDGRKKAGFNVEDRIKTAWKAKDKEIIDAIKSQAEYIAKETLSVQFEEGQKKADYDETIKLDGKEVWFGISKK